MTFRPERACSRFERLLDAIMFGQAVPFLGAGVSAPCRDVEAPKYPVPHVPLGKKIHSSPTMTIKLALQVLRDARKSDDSSNGCLCDNVDQNDGVDEAWWSLVCKVVPALSKGNEEDKGKAKEDKDKVSPPAKVPRDWTEKGFFEGVEAKLEEQKPLDLLIQQVKELTAVSAPLAVLSELVAHRHGYAFLCELLHLQEFVQLRPLPAHYAIARLMLERKIKEVITTNYDLCFERACADLVAPTAAWSADDRSLPWSTHVEVVSSAVQYMGLSSAPQTNEKIARRVKGRYYKINGCAREWRCAWITWRHGTPGDAYARPNAERVARRMILTERQLQNFRRETWAEGLFLDRARHCHLIFSGFGSEEPQIRHTALAIAQEFEALGSDRPNDGSSAHWNYGAAPWFQTYDAALSFTQMQVLNGWHRAWVPEPSVDHPPPYEPPRNWFGGADAEFFRIQNNQEKKKTLGADEFWTAVLFGTWRRDFHTSLWDDTTSALGPVGKQLMSTFDRISEGFFKTCVTRWSQKLFGNECRAPRLQRPEWCGTKSACASPDWRWVPLDASERALTFIFVACLSCPEKDANFTIEYAPDEGAVTVEYLTHHAEGPARTTRRTKIWIRPSQDQEAIYAELVVVEFLKALELQQDKPDAFMIMCVLPGVLASRAARPSQRDWRTRSTIHEGVRS